MKKIFIAGGASFDAIIHLKDLPQADPGTLFSIAASEAPGSTGVAKSIALARLGFDVTFHCLLGNDRYGELIKQYLTENGVKLLYDVDPAGTERHTNLMDEKGRRISIYTSYATFSHKTDSEKLSPHIAAADIVIININNYARDLIAVAKKYNKAIWCDIHDYDGANEYHRDFINAAEYLFMSADNLPDPLSYLTGAEMTEKKIVVCTKGSAGALISFGGKCDQIPALHSFPVIDTNGAGDSFMAGFIYAYYSGHDPATSARYGSIAGGMCISSAEISNPELTAEKIKLLYDQYYGAKTEEE